MTISASSLLIAHAAVTWFMAGLIWFVQVVHYPLMRVVGTDSWIGYERSHQRRTTLVVAPAMLLEAATAAMLLPPIARSLPLAGGSAELLERPSVAWLGAALLALIWLSTFLVQVPLHGRLERGFNQPAHRALVATNWVRTALWSARAVLAAALLVPPAPPH